MNTPHRDNDVPRAEIARRHKLEAIMHRTLQACLLAGDPGAEEDRQEPRQRDIYHAIKTYLARFRHVAHTTAMMRPTRDLRGQTLPRPGGDTDVASVDIRLRLNKHQHTADLTREPTAQPGPAATARAGDTVPMLRWLLTEAAGKIATVAHQLETRAAEIDDDARRQLQEDLIVLDEELTVVKALIDDRTDWDAEIIRLLAGEIPPLESDYDGEEDK